MATEHNYTPEELSRAQQQEDRINELRERPIASIIIDGTTYSEHYIKDLEDMLKRFIEWYPYMRPWPLMDEAKALLERTGYTDDF